MAFTLEITFTGLFMFVPDDRVADDKQLHVLLPPTAILGSNHKHFPRLIVDGRYTTTGKFKRVEFTRSVLSLAPLSKATTRPALPTLVDAGELADKSRIHPDQVKPGTLDPQLESRLSVRAPHAISLGQTTLWEIETLGFLYLSHQVKCAWVDLAEAPLRLEITGDTPDNVELQPDKFGVIKLELQHLPKEDHKPKKGEPAHHFPAYYEVFRTGKTGSSPILREDPPVLDLPAPEHFLRRLLRRLLFDEVLDPTAGASTFTCMGSTAPLA